MDDYLRQLTNILEKNLKWQKEILNATYNTLQWQCTFQPIII